MKQGLVFLIFCFILLAQAQAASSISTSAGWTQVIGATDLKGGCGTDLSSNFQSANNVTTITITGAGSGNWRVDVRKNNVTWDNRMKVYVLRTSDGSGNGSISGGESYIEVLDTNTQFFSGSGNRKNINIQYRLAEVSLAVAPNNYISNLTFTIVDLP